MKNIYFKCKKCGHHVYTDEIKKVRNLPNTECPECGEEGQENWIVMGDRE